MAKLPRGASAGVFGAERACVAMDVDGRAELAVGQDGKHGDGSAGVVCHECESSLCVEAHVRWAGAFRTYRVQESEIAGWRVDGEGSY